MLVVITSAADGTRSVPATFGLLLELIAAKMAAMQLLVRTQLDVMRCFTLAMALAVMQFAARPGSVAAQTADQAKPEHVHIVPPVPRELTQKMAQFRGAVQQDRLSEAAAALRDVLQGLGGPE